MTRYFMPHEAREELARRQQLRERVERWWVKNGWGMPPIPLDARPYGVLSRYIASARGEDILFARMAEGAGLVPLWLEFPADRYYVHSGSKRSYLRPTMVRAVGHKGLQTRGLKLVRQPHDWVGSPLREVTTDRGEPLVAWHHDHQDRVLNGTALRIDKSEWVGQLGPAKDHYFLYLSLFVAHGVLFEDFHGGESGPVLDAFTAEVYEPAHARLREEFGVDILVVALPWWEELGLYPNNPKLAPALLREPYL